MSTSHKKNMKDNELDFGCLVKRIESKEILLPDFQRKFVWTDEERQKQIVASVLCRMPIGSILLLESKANEYSSKMIGCKKNMELMNDENILFLIDGQQRITVLANVFSNVIYDFCDGFSDLVSPSLKRRFFLRIPKWNNCGEEQDLFGVRELSFKYKSTFVEPDFLTGDILSFIECLPFVNDDKKAYNPQVKLSTDLDEFCINYEKGYLIPLYLLLPLENVNVDQIELRFDTIMENIASKLGDEILDCFTQLQSDEEKINFTRQLFKDISSEEEKLEVEAFRQKLKDKERVWKNDFVFYLKKCLSSISLNEITVSESQRARAIDIYENLNRGGISLSTFDLVMAKVAKVSSENFYQRIVANIKTEKSYSKEVLPDVILKEIQNKIDDNSYNATLNINCYKEEKNEIANKYIDAFLNVLSLFCYNKEFVAAEFKLEYIKRNKILELKPEEIDSNCEKICEALDRAMFFFQTRCGIRNIQEINYSLMIVLVATIFIKDEWFKSKRAHDVLEAWYWASVFSGEFDKDQNDRIIKHLRRMVKTLNEEVEVDWINELKEKVLKASDFSDKELLLMQKGSDRLPKKILCGFICQYYLSRTYTDMFDNNMIISVFSDKADELEAHHIIPLGNVSNIGESTAKLRNNKEHICNSPLNFCYITRTSNKIISDTSLNEYVKKLCEEAKASLDISEYTSSIENEEDIRDMLGKRYEKISGAIKLHIKQLLK